MFFFYTDAHAAEYAASGRKTEYERMCLELVKPYDDFGYLTDGRFTIRFDSKQNLDDNFNGSLYLYSN